MKTAKVTLAVLLASLALLPGAFRENAAEASSHPQPVTIVWEGSTSPLGGVFIEFSASDVNDAGQVVFYAKNNSGDCGLFMGDGTSLTLLAGPGMATVDGTLGPTSLCPGGGNPLPSRPPVTNSGAVTAFEATLSSRAGIYANVGPTPTQPYPRVARELALAPGLGGGTYGPPELQDVSDVGGGEVLFYAPIGVGCATEALFVGTGGGSPTPVVRAGGGGGGCADTAPSGGGLYSGLGGGGGYPAVMNNSGRVAFHGIAGGSDEIDVSDYPSYASYRKVAVDGDTWAADPDYGDTLDVLGDPLVNDLGQVAFRADGGSTYGEGYYTAPSTDQLSEDGAGAGSCADGLDNGGDGLTDGADPECAQEDLLGANTCYNGIDDGGDGLADASDPDCAVAYQAQASAAVVSADPSVLGGKFTPCTGGTAFPAGGSRHRLTDSGQFIDIKCGADPVGIIAFPFTAKVIKDSEPLPSPLPAGKVFTDFHDLAVSESGKVSFRAEGDAGCAPSSAPCTGVFRSDFEATIKDTDGDGLLDDWEEFGMDVNQDGTTDLVLGTSKLHKDVFVEIDYMDCTVGGSDCVAPPANCTIPTGALPVGHDHMPNAAQEIADVITAFANAPVNNPDGATGITLHVTVDEPVEHNCFSTWSAVQPAPCKPTPATGTFEWYKCTYFTTWADRNGGNAANIKAAKQKVYHYSLWTHQQAALDCTSGSGEVWGNDYYVSLGGLRDADGSLAASSGDKACWGIDPSDTEDTGGAGSCTDGIDNGGGDEDGDMVNDIDGADPECQSIGTRNERSGTFMHELGHNLALCHGGPVGAISRICGSHALTNYKPNYLSVMNYTFQMDHTVPRGTTGVAASGSFLDYSRWALPPAPACPAINQLNNVLDETGPQPQGSGLGLDEAEGIDCNAPPAAPAGLIDWRTAFTVPTDTDGNGNVDNCHFMSVPATGAAAPFSDIDWNQSGTITGPSNANNGPVAAAINDPYYGPPVEPPQCATDYGQLQGFEDWTAILYDFKRSRANYSDGLPHSPVVPEQSEAESSSPAVGGSGDFPDIDGPSLEASDSSGGSPFPYAALAGALAAAVAVAAAGGWYARRRWVR